MIKLRKKKIVDKITEKRELCEIIEEQDDKITEKQQELREIIEEQVEKMVEKKES